MAAQFNIQHSTFNIRHSSPLTFDSVLLHFRGERPRRDAQELSGFGARTGAAESVDDLDLLDAADGALGCLLESAGEIERIAETILIPSRDQGDVPRLDSPPIAEDRRPLDAGFQLADVSGPFVFVE